MFVGATHVDIFWVWQAQGSTQAVLGQRDLCVDLFFGKGKGVTLYTTFSENRSWLFLLLSQSLASKFRQNSHDCGCSVFTRRALIWNNLNLQRQLNRFLRGTSGGIRFQFMLGVVISCVPNVVLCETK